jgi:hypothetical protein
MCPGGPVCAVDALTPSDRALAWYDCGASGRQAVARDRMAAGTGRETRLSALFPMLVTTTHGVCLCYRRELQIQRMVYAVLFSLLRK